MEIGLNKFGISDKNVKTKSKFLKSIFGAKKEKYDDKDEDDENPLELVK